MKVHIPFQEQFREAMLSGRKVCTSRTKWYGKVGDTFEVFGATFEVTECESESLWYVKENLYGLEGFDSPAQFDQCWSHLHPRKGFCPEQVVWIHWFKRVEVAR